LASNSHSVGLLDRRKEARKVMSNDFIGCMSFDTFGATIPTDNQVGWRESRPQRAIGMSNFARERRLGIREKKIRLQAGRIHQSTLWALGTLETREDSF
jgi:hypothetical protein